MYDIRQLESEWKKYKIKKRKPLFITILLTLCILLIVAILNMNKIDFSFFRHSIENFIISTPSEEKGSVNTLLNNGLVTLETKISSKPVEIEAENILVDIPILDIVDVKKNIDNSNGDRKKIHLDIVGTSSITAYEDVEKRFLQSHDIDDALFLAKSYFKRLDYEKAVYWALEANKLDENLEESVLIFIESKFKLGQKNEAISLLKNYLNKSDSGAGKILLERIENDRL